MDVPRILTAVVIATGPFLIASPLAAQTAPAPDFRPVQPAEPLVVNRERMERLREHRFAIEDALGSLRQTMPAEPMEPQSRALQAPEPVPPPAPPERAIPAEEPSAAARARGGVSCEAAAQIVADFGFSDIRSRDCSGDLYRFAATRDASAYSVTITAATGEIADVSRE